MWIKPAAETDMVQIAAIADRATDIIFLPHLMGTTGRVARECSR